MSIKAFFVDFYGTIVHEDGEVIKKITDIICKTGRVEDPSEVDAFWWKDFQAMCTNSFGETFETQRVLEERSLVHTLERFGSDADAKELSNMMFAHWMRERGGEALDLDDRRHEGGEPVDHVYGLVHERAAAIHG